MSDPNVSKPPVTKEAKPGFAKPIERPPSGKLPDHIHEDTLMAKGFDPDTKERVAVNVGVLKVEFGEKKGRELYGQIARLGGFLDPDTELATFNEPPDLDLSGLDNATRAKVDALLEGK